MTRFSFQIVLGVVARLKLIICRIETACQKQYMKNSSKEWRELLTSALYDLTTILENESTVSAFELHSSGLIQVKTALIHRTFKEKKSNSNFSQVLLNLFSTAAPPHANENAKLARKLLKFQKQRVEIFKECFKRYKF